MKKRILILIWFMLSFAVYMCLEFLHGTPKEQAVAQVNLAILMVAMTFPLSLVNAAIWLLMTDVIGWDFDAGVDTTEGICVNLLVWLSFALAGYFQWFVLFPKLVRWIKNRLRPAQASRN